jgi:hypothetical protein
MTDLRDAARQALEALTWCEPEGAVVTAARSAAIDALRAALGQTEQEPWVKTYSGGKPNHTQRFTLSCGCPSQHGGVPAYWERDGSTAFGMICERHWHEYGARSEA